MKRSLGLTSRFLLAATLVVAGLPVHGVVSGIDSTPAVSQLAPALHDAGTSDGHGNHCDFPENMADEMPASDCEEDSGDCCGDNCPQTCSGLVLLGPTRLPAQELWLPPHHADSNLPTLASRAPERLLRPPRY